MSDAGLPLDGDVMAMAAELTPPPRAGSKRKRVVLSIHDKQQVLQRLEAGEQPVAIAQAFGISRQQVSDIKKNRERIVAFCTDAKHLSTLKRKTLKASAEFHPGVEQELYRWVIRQRRLGRNVSAEAMTAKTTDLFMQYAHAHMSSKAVANWLRHFKRAHGLKTLSDDELQQLPEQFEPAMDVATGDTDNSTAQLQVQADAVSTETPPPVSYFMSATHTNGLNVLANPTSSVETVMDMNAYMHAMSVQGDAVQTQLPVAAPAASLQTTAGMVQQLNAQLGRFEREMETKLDYLDERVTKLCYLTLGGRLT
jgi:hypothetical protein